MPEFSPDWSILERIRFSFLNTPLLSDVTISFRLWSVSPCALRKLSSSLPLLESLFLSVEPYQGKKPPRRLPVFANTKKLVLQVKDADKRLRGYILLVQSSPYIKRLDLHLFNSAKECRIAQTLPDSRRLHLKEIMITGFHGTSHEIMFTRYLLRNSPALEQSHH